MAFRISEYRDTEFNDLNGTNVWEIDTKVYCDTVADLPTPTEINNYKLAMGCKAIIIANGDKYFLNSSGTWIKDTSSGGGGGGGSDVEIISHTTQEWETLGTATSKKDTIYVYTDGVTIGSNTYPAIKIGDGVTTIFNLSFVTDPSGSVAVTGVSYDTTTRKLTQTIGGQSSDILTVDDTPTDDSMNPITSNAVYDGLAGKANTATTLSGYGITDAKIDSGTITLGSNTITPLISSDVVSTYSPSGTAPINGSAITDALDPISETEYSQLVTKDRPLYFIYDDSV